MSKGRGQKVPGRGTLSATTSRRNECYLLEVRQAGAQWSRADGGTKTGSCQVLDNDHSKESGVGSKHSVKSLVAFILGMT